MDAHSAADSTTAHRQIELQLTLMFWIMFLAGAVLMAAGCFVPYSAGLLFCYVLCLAVYGVAYFLYYGIVAAPRQAFFNWIFFFFLFPKKAVRGEYDVLLSRMLGHRDFSFYEMSEILIVGTLVFVLLVRPIKEHKRLPPWKPFNGLFWFSYMAVTVGLLNLALCISGFKPALYDGLVMWRSLWPLIVGIVIWTASGRFIRRQGEIKIIMLTGVLAAFGLALEFLVSKYTRLLPATVLYFEFDPQLGNFRSAWQSTGGESGLLVGQLMIIGIGCTYGWLFFRRPAITMACVGLFLWVLLYTYNRGSLAAGFGACIIIGWLAARRWRLVVIAFVACAAALFAIDWNGKYWLIQRLGVAEVKTGDSTFFGTRSVFERLGAQMRGVEVFLHEPILGAGPGHLWAQMGSPSVPQIFDIQKANESSQGMYSAVSNPEYKTNTHNLAVDFMAEYGIVGLCVEMLFLTALIRVGFGIACARFSNERLDGFPMAKAHCIGAYGALAGICIYFSTQAVPLLYGLMALMLRVALVSYQNAELVRMEGYIGGKSASDIAFARLG
jgi:hypothetical protein